MRSFIRPPAHAEPKATRATAPQQAEPARSDSTFTADDRLAAITPAWGVVQRSAMPAPPDRRHADPLASKRMPNRTGLPDRLKANVEALSGLPMDDVRVHRHSAKPGRLGALAFAQGTNIHLSSGQERHLPHEAWHVVQQKRGQVKPQLQFGGTSVNIDPLLELEADTKGHFLAGPAIIRGQTDPLTASHKNGHFALDQEVLQAVFAVQVRAKKRDDDSVGSPTRGGNKTQDSSLEITTQSPNAIRYGDGRLISPIKKSSCSIELCYVNRQ